MNYRLTKFVNFNNLLQNEQIDLQVNGDHLFVLKTIIDFFQIKKHASSIYLRHLIQYGEKRNITNF